MFGTVDNRIRQKKSPLFLLVFNSNPLKIADQQVTIRDAVREMREGDS